MTKRFLFLESKTNDTVVRVRVKDIRKVAGSEGWGSVGDEFGVQQMKAHRHGWTVIDEPELEPEPPFRDGDVLKNRFSQYLYYYRNGLAQLLSPADEHYNQFVELAEHPLAWSGYEVVYSDPSVDR